MKHRQTTPIYARIKQHLLDRIASGELSPGDRLPSESELAEAFSTTRTTVRHALTQLVFEDVIVRQVGRGSYVTEKPRIISPFSTQDPQSFEEQVAQTGSNVKLRPLSFGVVPADEKTAKTLRMETGTDIYLLRRLRLINDRPVCLELRYIPVRYAEKVTGEMLGNRPAHDFLSDIIGERIPTIAVAVVAEIADKETSELLNLKEGSALIVRENTYFDTAGRPIQCGASIFPGDIRLEYVLGRHPGETSPD